MWDSQHASTMHSKIRVVDGISEGEMGLEMHMQNHGEKKSQEEITDDDVFKELINIVMDVFSNKSEKCMLAFELPVESEVLTKTPPEELTVENGSELSSNASKSDIMIPLTNSSRWKLTSKSKRKLRVPMVKTSKYKLKKKCKKKLNLIRLSPKPGFTKLERPFGMNLQQRHLNDRNEKVTEPSRNTADGWEAAAEREELLNEVSHLQEKITYPQQGTNKDALINLCSEFKDAIEALDDLACSQEHELTRISFAELSYHLEEIQCHIGAIKNSLKNSKSFESVDTMLQLTSTESYAAPKRKNKVGVKLIRIGAPISQKSSIQMARCSKKQHKHNEYKQNSKTKEIGLCDILKNYQKVKKEETEIVQVLLGKLGFRRGRSNKYKIRSKPPKQELFGTVQPCEADKVQRKEAARTARDIREDMIEGNDNNTLKELQSSITHGFKPIQRQMSILDDKKGCKQRNYRSHKDTYEKNRKRRGLRKRPREITIKRSRDRRDNINPYNKQNTPLIYSCPLKASIGRDKENIEGKARKSKIENATSYAEMQPNPSVASNESRMMRQIQSAAKRLEYMHSLVEKKLNHLSKQQKELKRKLIGKASGMYTPRECRSNDGNQNGVNELPKGSHLNLSTEIEELIFQPYRNVTIYESKNLEETLSCHMSERVSENRKLSQNPSSTLEIPGSVKQEPVSSNNNQNYVCNYMMEVRERELEGASTGCMNNQCGSDPGDVGNASSAIVLRNEFKEDSISNGLNNDLPTSSLLSVTTKENEGEIIEESLFANQPLPNDAQKPTGRKKKKRVIYTPLCTLT